MRQALSREVCRACGNSGRRTGDSGERRTSKREDTVEKRGKRTTENAGDWWRSVMARSQKLCGIVQLS